MRALVPFALVAVVACAPGASGAPRPSGATAPSPAQAPARSSAHVSGVVRDSASLLPIAGAVVQISSADPAVTFTAAARSDSLGRYRIADVPAGRYSLGFLHPRLDSLGVQASVRLVRVRAGRETKADLAGPSAALLKAAYCGPRDGGALVIGVVRRASDRSPVAGAAVVGEWLEFVVRRERLERQQPAIYARAGADGGYALCNVPAIGSVFVSANVGPDTTDRIELVADRSGVMRRDLYVGPVRDVAVVDSVVRSDSLAPSARRRRAGDGIVRGTVRAEADGRPLEGALVRITDGPQTRANVRGDWTLVDVPSGTRVLEVRAIGYYPVQRPVDVVAGEARVAVSLWTFQSVLDTVKVIATRVADRSGGGFERRRRSAGVGTFVDSAGMRRRGGLTTSDIFRSMNGVRLDGNGLDRYVTMRGSFGYCTPSVWVDGLYLAQPQADEIDLIAPRERVTGIEVYNDATTPAEFQRALSGCGAIVIWTRAPRR
jgi:hypothetical protein